MSNPTYYRPIGSDEDVDTIFKIVDRAGTLADKHGHPLSGEERVCMSLAIGAVHADDPIDLTRFLEADSGNFSHDAFGILRHFNPESGKLEDCFLPRFTI